MATEFVVEPNRQSVPVAERAKLLANPGFGRVFSDHMAMIKYTEGKGWHDAKISARKPLTLDPASAVLHYAQEIFEGMKAYRLADGSMALFRPDANARRFQELSAAHGDARAAARSVHRIGAGARQDRSRLVS